ncbi:MAG: 2Fe-2S iron-sulfur cluster-binding protein [Desulfobacteraceae bacterium]|jgi:bidirectional [NiFe] hydrogenase diaphorase subunit|nr:2Fe-2S iron-sulfur cluster-binding protein [Desulfobacteraceae bacterium]MDH3572543.1 2Fe-2S iron-sulfur cluster-binding protein [Desulfobacteraceae bacterium]MDH3719992.1 2Fe-2S iron-sulfur cluster-binding protein [Desulfobacteraceae bacterium]MDH3836445.1 2Fe-2S iron-sulfur cluster-binding protein [Desulfobacteraceae bacterium]MDH3873508.1 2Fe-2S iron-sulfur cluster-binding protein [Desulfobacteraceae bacterium]
MILKLRVDNQEIETKEGKTLLQACLDNQIYIPNLCYLENVKSPSASCRMCFVEIEGIPQPVPSCTVQVIDDMVVKTDTSEVRQLQRTALRLLLSVHDVDCKNCHANKKCELQNIAKFLKVSLKPKRLERYLKETQIDETHPFLTHYPNRCVLCGKCVHTCREKHGQSVLTFAKRGFDTVISTYSATDASSLACGDCDSCVKACPVGALAVKESSQ